MRLHSLRVQALQAFAGSAEIDFDALSEAGLFLLHGETGAGKTTLLDAVCFALYGKLPGARGSEARERSDHAPPKLPTEVVLELTLRGERLRITRTPKQERPKQRGGEGLRTVAATVLLERVAADGTVAFALNRVDEVQEELDRLLGMSREQFCQVVLLPQGQFATFLRARSDEREELLARLFGTERFEQAEAWLTEHRRQSEKDVQAAMQELRGMAARLSQVLEADAPEEWERDPSGLARWADEAQVVADAERATADGVYADAAAGRQAADAGLVAVRTAVERRARHARAAQELAAFEAGAEARAADAARLDRARAAAGVVPYVRAAAARADQATAAHEAAEHARSAVGSLDAGPEALREQAARLRTAAGEVGALAEVEAQVRARADELVGVAQEQGRVLAARDAVEAWLDGTGERLAALAAAAEAGRVATARREEHAALAEDAARRLAAAERRDRAAAEREDRRAAVLSAGETAQGLRGAWLDLRERRLNGMAAELAATLEDGVACPVCGADEHPEPAAHRHGDRVVTADQEDEAQRAAETAAGAVRLAETALGEVENTLAAALALAGETPVAELAAAADAARELAASTARTAEGAEAAASLRERFATEQAGHEAARATAAVELAALAERGTALEAAQAQDRARLDAALAGSATVSARVVTLAAQAEGAEDAAAATERAGEAAVEAREAAAAATAAAHGAGFADAAAAQAAALAEAEVARIEAELRAHADGLAERRALVADAELVAAVAAPEPDELGAQAAAREATEVEAAASQALERVRGRAEQLQGLRRDLARRLAVHGPAAARAATVRGVATLVDGTSSQNRKRMRLRAYVLAARLEEIATAATVRLATMSDGRYALALDDERAARGARSGLGLRVIDGWTGRDRHPSSLSGGETFQASLALALGLADVVAAEAGGARLETLFVDEGFGTLDERALDNALEVLDRLREGGRAVGVVSHVAELRQRIAAQVHVVKQREGSRVRQTV